MFLVGMFSQSGVRLVRGIVKDVEEKKIILDDGTEVPYGLLVWSTGVGPSSFVKNLDFPKAPGGRYLFFGSCETVFLPSFSGVDTHSANSMDSL